MIARYGMTHGAAILGNGEELGTHISTLVGDVIPAARGITAPRDGLNKEKSDGS